MGTTAASAQTRHANADPKALPRWPRSAPGAWGGGALHPLRGSRGPGRGEAGWGAPSVPGAPQRAEIYLETESRAWRWALRSGLGPLRGPLAGPELGLRPGQTSGCRGYRREDGGREEGNSRTGGARPEPGVRELPPPGPPGTALPGAGPRPPTHRGRERPPGRGRGCTWGAPGRSARSSASWSSSSAPPGAPASPSSLPAELGPWPSPSASSSQVESQSGSSMLSAGGARAGRKLPGREEARGRGGAGLRARGRGGGAPSGARLPCTSRARGCP